ncbi:DNA-binding GntR family transcriptional regulator [Virgibacillus halotolerans]|uniref:GntR family transcriptional regulator n=1 Tax=Virgibacillus halotolerans TaxID=1071053 RepID=UPI001960BFF1|nr:GntR family transcriptional regulator [Virgibacillus halotolerans]MBM7599463.1 DNA-binding GntR family transcriptional regulator [Virgibacillus halotolerans]
MTNNRLDLHLDTSNVYSLSDRVCQALREAILKGTFKPGERLVQEEIANSLGVSRMPIREAFRKLEAEELVHMEPNRGAVVKPLLVEDIEEIYLLRSVLEKMAVAESLKKIQRQDIIELESLVTIMDQADDVEHFVKTNIEFHRLLMKHCTKRRLLSFIETLWNGFPQHTPHLLDEQEEMSNEEHHEMLAAVKENDADKVAEIVSHHIKRTGDALVEYIKSNASEEKRI